MLIKIGQKSIPIMKKNIIVDIGGSKVRHILRKLTFNYMNIWSMT